MQIKIVSWNIWTDGNFLQTVDFLRSANADVIGLQEVRSDTQNKNIINHLSGLGYEYAFSLAQKYNNKEYGFGPAIFSKYPITKKTIHELSKENKRVAVEVDIDINGSILHVFSTHLIHTHQKASKIQENQAKNFIKIIQKNKAVVMGDFNATPESKTIKIIKRVLTDTDPSSRPTWCLYKEGCNVCNIETVNIKLDYIFTTKDIKAKLFKVEKSKASDHLPISANIEI